MFTVQDGLTALKDGLTAYFDESLRKAPAPVSDTLFESVQDARHTSTIGGVFGTGRFSSVDRGTDLPKRAPFERAETTIVANRLGEIRVFSKDVMREIMATLTLPGQPPNRDILKATDDWAKSYNQTRDQLCADVINSTATIFDGQQLFSAAHPQRSKTLDGASFSNVITTFVGAVTAGNVQTMLQRLQDDNAYSENGEPVDVSASHLVVTTQQDYFDALTVLRSIQIAGNNNNDVNVVQNIVQPLLWRRAAQSTGYWYVAIAKSGFYYKEEQALEIETAYDFDSKAYQASAEFLGQAAVADWRGIVRATKN